MYFSEGIRVFQGGYPRQYDMIFTIHEDLLFLYVSRKRIASENIVKTIKDLFSKEKAMTCRLGVQIFSLYSLVYTSNGCSVRSLRAI